MGPDRRLRTRPRRRRQRPQSPSLSASVRVHARRGAAAVTLRSGDLEATFLPELNLLGVSLRFCGEEYLALPGGIAAYRRLHTTGLPLLAPWANRLERRSYRRGRITVELEGLDLHTDGRGLPIHGTLSAHDAWEVSELSARGSIARLRASFDYSQARLLEAFPFPHRLEALVEVDGRTLSLATTLRPTGRRAVPVCFGYHPYLRLPHGSRSSWRLRLPRRERLELDARGIPSGRRRGARAEREPIRARTLDDLFALASGATLAIETGRRRLSVRYGAGYGYGQVFAPPGTGFVCIEPMTAPTNALVTGECGAVTPGKEFTARFSLRPEWIGPGTA